MAIGGHTIAELQSRMTPAELRVWGLYRGKYGPMNPVRRFDAGPAIVASVINNAHGGKATPNDYMPYNRPPEPEPDEVMKLLMADKNIKRGR